MSGEHATYIPESVRKQGQRADELIKGGLADPNTPQEGSGVEPQEGDQGQHQQADPEPKPQPQGEDQDTWKQKYEVLQGKYNAEVPQLYRDNRQLQQQVQQLTQQMQELQQSFQSQGGQQGQKQEQQGDINPEDFEDYGKEFQDLVKTINSLRAENQDLKAQVGNVNQEVGSVKEYQQSDVEGRFWNQLNQTVPKWKEINQDQEFLNWLGEVNPWTGQPRNDSLQDAHQKMDANRVAAIFNDWLSTQSGARYRQQEQGQQEQGKKRPQNVQPSKSRAEQPQADSKPQWTGQQIKEFYDKVRRGQFKGREEEMNKIEQDIFQAQKDGRITP